MWDLCIEEAFWKFTFLVVVEGWVAESSWNRLRPVLGQALASCQTSWMALTEVLRDTESIQLELNKLTQDS